MVGILSAAEGEINCLRAWQNPLEASTSDRRKTDVDARSA